LDLDKVDEYSMEILREDNIILKKQSDIENDLNRLTGRLLYDPQKTGVYYLNCFSRKVEKIAISDFTQIMKAVKNKTEIENLRKTCLKDSIAVTKFLYWLDLNIESENLTELDVSEKLLEFRNQIEDFQGISFTTIVAFGENAAMMHYVPNKENKTKIKSGNFLLIDSGGQYSGGTTDVTRTIAIGKIDDEKKRHFSLVVKGYIGVNRAIFLEGTRGCNLDILAREPIWRDLIDYKCGTGHGIGFNLSVHEGPQNLSQMLVDVPLQEGMIITDEPGIYLEGKYGIRIENDLLVSKYGESEFGIFLNFETLNYIPIDVNAIQPEELSYEEKDFLNLYHEEVRKRISPYLNEKEKRWLEFKTRKI
jgi:Xaa-Pro aminopeptidase